MLIVKTLILYILQRLKISPTDVTTLTYYPSTSWTNAGQVELAPGLYRLYWGYNYGAPTGAGLSSTTQSFPSIVLSETTTGGAKQFVFWTYGEELRFWAKCSSSSTAGKNNIYIHRLISA